MLYSTYKYNVIIHFRLFENKSVLKRRYQAPLYFFHTNLLKSFFTIRGASEHVVCTQL